MAIYCPNSKFKSNVFLEGHSEQFVVEPGAGSALYQETEGYRSPSLRLHSLPSEALIKSKARDPPVPLFRLCGPKTRAEASNQEGAAHTLSTDATLPRNGWGLSVLLDVSASTSSLLRLSDVSDLVSIRISV